MKIYVDMDGILVDLVGQIQRDYQPVIPWEPGEYNLLKVYGVPHDKWENLSIDWWANLEKTKEADQIVELVTQYGDLNILSKPSSQMCIKGKFEWLQWHYPQTKTENMFFVESKHHLARPDTILIDDCSAIVEEFRACGGKAFLYPRHWNDEHAKADENNVKSLKNFLAKCYK